MNFLCNITVISRELQSHEIIDPILKNDLIYLDEHIVLDYSRFVHIIRNIQKKLVDIKHNKIDSKIGSGSKNDTRSFGSIKNKIYIKLLSFVRNNINATIDHLARKNYAKIAIKYVRKNSAYFDVVLSSFEPLSAHLIGGEIKKRHPDAFWIADFRDPAIVSSTPKKYINFYTSYIDRVARTADVFTGVSDICIKIFENKCNKKLYTICNGFDRDDLSDIIPNKNNKLTFTYTGHLNREKQDLAIIFKAISELINENKIHKDNIVINYAGNGEIEFRKQIEKYDLLESTKFHGFIDRRASLQLQMDSDILFLASWNTIGYTGVVTGKFLEYLMINKPILCAVVGNLANSQLKEMVTKANNGVVWEEANDKNDYPILKSYILEQYEHFIKNEPLLFDPNMDYIEQFNYKNIAQQFIDLIEANTRVWKYEGYKTNTTI